MNPVQVATLCNIAATETENKEIHAYGSPVMHHSTTSNQHVISICPNKKPGEDLTFK